VHKKGKVKEEKQTAPQGRLVVDDDSYLPFANVKLVEKKESEVPKKKELVKRKEPVVLFDKDIDFGDILAAWEAGQDPTAIPAKDLKSYSKVEDGRSFAEIFDEWEKEHDPGHEKHQRKETILKSQTYKQTKSFADILTQFEGVKESKAKEKPLQQIPKVSREPHQTKKSEVRKSDKSFGDILTQFEGKKIQQGDVPVEKPEPKSMVRPAGPGVSSVKSEGKVSNKEFGEMLDTFEDKKQQAENHVAWSFAQIYKDWSATTNETKAIEQAQKQKQEVTKAQLSISELRTMQPQVTLDLHGYKAEDASLAVRKFLKESFDCGLLKICLIPGKGIHNEHGTGILKEVVLSEIRLSNVVREAYSPKACYGGSGAVWVILKERTD